jgi:hypothetical protein
MAAWSIAAVATLPLVQHPTEHLVGPPHRGGGSTPTRDERENLLGVCGRNDCAPPRPDIGELAERDLERDGHLVEAIDRDRLLTALHFTDELATERGAVAQPPLAEAPLLPKLSHTLPEELSDVWDGTV